MFKPMIVGTFSLRENKYAECDVGPDRSAIHILLLKELTDIPIGNRKIGPSGPSVSSLIIFPALS